MKAISARSSSESDKHLETETSTASVKSYVGGMRLRGHKRVCSAPISVDPALSSTHIKGNYAGGGGIMMTHLIATVLVKGEG